MLRDKIQTASQIYWLFLNAMNLIKLSWKNLIADPLSSLLSLLLLALGVGLTALILLINTQLAEKFDKNQAGIDLVIGAKGSPLELILSSIYHVGSPTGNISLKEARPYLNPKHPLFKQIVPLALGDSYQNYRIVGTQTNYLDLYDIQLRNGELWSANFEVTIGATVAHALDLQVGDTFYSVHGVGTTMEHDTHPFKVVGILEQNGSVLDQLILTNISSVWESHATHEEEEHHEEHDHEGHDHEAIPPPLLEASDDKEVTSILIIYKNRTDIRVLNLVRHINGNTDMMAASPVYETARLFEMLGIGEAALRAIAIVVMIVSALSVFISLFKSLRARSYELAMMRVLGGSPRQLFLLVILEGLILAVLGYVVGILGSHIGMEILTHELEDFSRYAFTGWRFLIEELYLLGVAVGIGLVAALLPALRALRMEISRNI